MAYRFDKKSILNRMHFKKAKKKTFGEQMLFIPRLGLKATATTFKGGIRVAQFAVTKKGFALAGAMVICIATGIALYQPQPSGDEGIASGEIIVMPSEDSGQFINKDSVQKMTSSEVIDHLADHDLSNNDKTSFHSRTIPSGPSLLLSQTNKASAKEITTQNVPELVVMRKKQAKNSDEKTNGVKLMGTIEFDDSNSQPVIISSRPLKGQSIK